jgi:hypothetical protein
MNVALGGWAKVSLLLGYSVASGSMPTGAGRAARNNNPLGDRCAVETGGGLRTANLTRRKVSSAVGARPSHEGILNGLDIIMAGS